MDVFGKGDIRPLDPPGVCFICEQSPHQDAELVVNTNRHFMPGGPTHLTGRKYVCGSCAEELGKNVGMVDGAQVAELSDSLAARYSQVGELSEKVADLEKFHELAARLLPKPELEPVAPAPVSPEKKKPAAKVKVAASV